MLAEVISWLVATIGRLGYAGIMALMFLESSFFPFPSEVVIPPAGYLASKGRMEMALVIASGTAGSLLGALFNYWVALRLGRPFLQRYGRYFLIRDSVLERADRFFQRHGHISTFVGRLLPGIRQYISLPAGLARMDLWVFSLCTSLGAGLWVTVLALVGYWVGEREELLHRYLKEATLAAVAFALIVSGIYLWRMRSFTSRR
ncbi:MAG: DedA family protein [Deltaproteobacteria bacterium]|nr:MAG: DedA family protein [Deltaproteobacteria bacterium]